MRYVGIDVGKRRTMESKHLMILSVWIALSVICAVFIWVGGASLGNYVFCYLFFSFALIFIGVIVYALNLRRNHTFRSDRILRI